MATQDEQTKISGYRRLSEEELAFINSVKASGNSIGALIETMEQDPNLDQRWVSIAKTDLQRGFMALIRSIAKPEGF